MLLQIVNILVLLKFSNITMIGCDQLKKKGDVYSKFT